MHFAGRIQIYLQYIGTISFTGAVVANGQGSGAGGQVTVQAWSLTGTGTSDTVNVDALGDGNGGTIAIDTNNNDITIGGGSSSLTLSAQALGAGNGGTISVNTDNPGNVFIQTALLQAQALGAGNGGSISVNTNSNGDVNLDTATLLVTAANGTAPGSITLNGNSISFSTAGELNADASQGGGQISLTSQVGDINVGYGEDDAITLSAQALSTGNGGSIELISAGNVGINPANFLLSAAISGDTGDGGTLTVNSTQSLFTSGTVVANGQGSGTGGTLTLTIFDWIFNDSTSLNALGGSSGDGGSVFITQNNTGTGTTDLSDLSLYVDGGIDSGDGGDVTLSYAAAALNIGGISATSPSDGDGGNITISNTSDVDMEINLYGDLDTSEDGDYGGSITLNPYDINNNNLLFTVQEEGYFISMLSASAQSIDIESTPAIALGIANMATTNGDLTINVAVSGSVSASRLQSRDPLQGGIQFDEGSDVPPQVDINNGNINISAPKFIFKKGFVNQTGGDFYGEQNWISQTGLYYFYNGYLLNGNVAGTGTHPVNLPGISGFPTQIVVQTGPKQTGIVGSLSTKITSAGSDNITFTPDGSGRVTFTMNTAAPFLTAQILSDSGNITVDPNIDISSNAPVTVQSNNGAINLGGAVTGSGSVTLSTNPGTAGPGSITLGSDVTVTDSTFPPPGNEYFQATAGGDFSQLAGTIKVTHQLNIVAASGTVNLAGNLQTTGTSTLDEITINAFQNLNQTAGIIATGGYASLQSKSGNIGSASQPIQLNAYSVAFNTSGSTGDVFANETSAIGVRMADSLEGLTNSVSGNLNFAANGPLTLVDGFNIKAGKTLSLQGSSITVSSRSISTSNGTLTLNATTGTIQISGTSPTISSTGGDVVIQLEAVTIPYPNDPKAQWDPSSDLLTVNPGNGSVFWGTAASGCPGPYGCGIDITSGGNTISVPVNNVSFDTKGIVDGIVLNGSVSISAN